MKNNIQKAAILCAESKGSVAGLLAEAGIPTYLLGLVPEKMSDTEKRQGLSLESPAFRNRIAANNKTLLLAERAAGLSSQAKQDLIRVGNIEDNLDWLRDCDWVLEVLPDNLAVKKTVLQQIEPFLAPETIVSSSTSSLSINSIADDMPLAFKQYWLGTHFFYPVRQMKLLELIPGQDTLPEVVDFMARFGETVLGKGIIRAKDTPAFIADRLGSWIGPSACRHMLELGLNIAEVDAIAGTAIGRPATAIFGLYDLVGLDIAWAAAEEVKQQLVDPMEQENYSLPDFFAKMVIQGRLGKKSQGGFYKRIGQENWVMDVQSLTYEPLQPVRFASLDAAGKTAVLSEKLMAFFAGKDRAAQFIWKNLTGLFLYAASRIPELADDIVAMDRALCWGYNHTKGPFALWNGLDLEKYLHRLENEGAVIPGWIKEMLAVGCKTFYISEAGVDYYYAIPEKKYLPVKSNEEGKGD